MQNFIVLSTLIAMLLVETFLIGRGLAPLRSRASFRRRRRRMALLAQ